VRSFDRPLEELLAECQVSALHLEMRDHYMLDDPAYLDWQAGRRIDPVERWRDWFKQLRATVDRGVQIRRARIVSEPVTDYIKFEYDVTDGLNIAAGEAVRWLPRRKASDLALPGNDFWLFDERVVQFSHFSGDGDWLGIEGSTDPTTVELCRTAFEAVWKRAIPHDRYRVTDGGH
jgi:hypothetical protein